MKKRKETKEERQRRIQEGLDSVFDEPFGKKREKADKKNKKYYTYMISCSFKMQYTFTEKEVEQAEEGGEGDLDPIEDALMDLEKTIKDRLEPHWAVSDVEAWTDFDELLGVIDDDEDLD